MSKEVEYEMDCCFCECDKCGENILIAGTDYYDINKELRDGGWIIKKINGAWHEFCCEECYQDFLKEKK